MDSGAEISIWPTGLVPIETTPNEHSIARVKYWRPGDVDQPSIPDEGSRTYQIRLGNDEVRTIKVHVGPVRKPLLAVCDLCDHGHDVYFAHTGHAWAEHSVTGAVTPFVRVGGRYEIEATVVLPETPFKGQGHQDL